MQKKCLLIRMMTIRIILLGLIGSISLSLNGCQYMHVNRYFNPDETLYLKSKNEPPLKIPAGLSESKLSKSYGIPNTPPGNPKISILPPDLEKSK